ncbi:cyclic GMP-AMP synthase isoform X2 [Manis pentadactyla]|uniref:cyclic GMP-AMP synthase isoform X2 n=1 Tax=Manis pentadactyla TaxID=143292 RepID=UPI00255CDA7E|nr:cyclic GMP-AMP synthase isoform X2 [Manis pentadactyla]
MPGAGGGADGLCGSNLKMITAGLSPGTSAWLGGPGVLLGGVCIAYYIFIYFSCKIPKALCGMKQVVSTQNTRQSVALHKDLELCFGNCVTYFLQCLKTENFLTNLITNPRKLLLHE